MATTYRVVVIGASAGGSNALLKILPVFPADYPLPIVIVQHLHPLQESAGLLYRNSGCVLTLKEAEEKDVLRPGFVYFAPPNYHLLIEDDKTFSLSIDPKINYTRPSIDVLFESAVDAFGDQVIGVLLSGANQDGANGLLRIKLRGGMTIVQDPDEAEVGYMPKSAIELGQPAYVLEAAEIAPLLLKLANPNC
jgi:two-component system, chemotaxis family, protein-glutamate methylesterase/glutaminase